MFKRFRLKILDLRIKHYKKRWTKVMDDMHKYDYNTRDIRFLECAVLNSKYGAKVIKLMRKRIELQGDLENN